ncbi:MAG: hypothetical protein IPJ65_15450 [Archangiaceae bacterium]|nr:hypothetical protein [Archangiaceae bacterium]
MLFLLCLAGCSPQLKPETLVDALRVLAITAEPPEVAPGQSAALNVLQLDPSRPGGKTTVIWVGCEPDPFGLGRSACNDTSALLQPTSFTTFPEGVRILGIGNKANYASASTLFAPIGADDPNRFNGVVGPVLAVVIAEEIDPTSTNEELRDLFHRIETQEVQSVFALSRITVSEKPSKNQNPHLTGLVVDGTPLPQNGTLTAEPGASLTLHVTAGDAETYPVKLPEGEEQRTEQLVGAWYSSAGRFSLERFDLAGEEDTVFTAPGAADIPEDPVPSRRQGTLWLVLRDGRGGQSFSTVPFFVCDDSLPEPKPASVMSPTSEGELVRVRGANMASVVDVTVNGVALPRGAYSPVADAFLGEVPAGLAPGRYKLGFVTKKCTTLESELELVVP